MCFVVTRKPSRRSCGVRHRRERFRCSRGRASVAKREIGGESGEAGEVFDSNVLRRQLPKLATSERKRPFAIRGKMNRGAPSREGVSPAQRSRGLDTRAGDPGTLSTTSYVLKSSNQRQRCTVGKLQSLAFIGCQMGYACISLVFEFESRFIRMKLGIRLQTWE